MYNEMREEYTKIAGSRSLFNKDMNESMFMSAIGAAMMKREFIVQHVTQYDLRMHGLWIQPSRTGKGVSLNIMNDFANLLDLKMVQQLQFTDAGVVGTVDQNIININKKEGYLPGDPDFVDPVIVGDLGVYDIVAFSEAKQMFKVGAHTEDKLEILQTVMDVPKPDSYNVRKKLGVEIPIQYNSTSTIYGTTYFLEEFAEVLLKQGLFQRMFVGVKDISWKKRERLNEALIFAPKGTIPFEVYQSSLEELSDKVSQQLNSYKDGTILKIDKSGLKALQYLNRERMKYVKKNISGTELEIVEPFLTAMVPMNIKMAGQRAILNNSDLINYQDVQQTREDIMLYLKSIVNNIMTRVSAVNLEATRRWVLSYLGATKATPKDELIAKMTKKLFVSHKRCNVILGDLIRNKTLKTDPQGRITVNR